MKDKKLTVPINSANPPSNMTILGTYEGECADANITNKNGLDITRPVWENVFSSEDYQQAIELGWYIGYLGHPEDPNCMDFMNACIVMTEGHIEDNGKVYGKFNLIDTPVGRIVAAFQDAGVQFGISVRGAGDIVANSVDPDTFIFRGFDLVTFPAFPESIPTFTKIAASSDAEVQAKYKKVCAAVTANLDSIQSATAIDIIQSQFAKQSDEYAALEGRKQELLASTNCPEDAEDITASKLQGMTTLYLEQVAANKKLCAENIQLKSQLHSSRSEFSRKLKSIERITASQAAKLRKSITDNHNAYLVVSAANKKLKEDNSTLNADNLKYNRKISASDARIRKDANTIAELRTKLSETVADANVSKTQASNRDEEIKRLRSEISATRKLLSEYQQAYAAIYANALGVPLKQISIKCTTSVSALQKVIGSTSTANISNVFVEPDVIDVIDEESPDDELITI